MQYKQNRALKSLNTSTLASVSCNQKRKSKSLLAQHNKQYHVKELLQWFCLNGHTLGFYPQTQKLSTRGAAQ